MILSRPTHPTLTYSRHDTNSQLLHDRAFGFWAVDALPHVFERACRKLNDHSRMLDSDGQGKADWNSS